MEFLRRAERELVAPAFGVAGLQDIALTLAPQRVRQLGDDRLQVRAVERVARVRSQRVERAAERAERGEDADRPSQALAGSAFHQIPHGTLEGLLGGLRSGLLAESRGRPDARSPRTTAPRRRDPARRGRGRSSRVDAEHRANGQRAAHAVLVEPMPPIRAAGVRVVAPAHGRPPGLRLEGRRLEADAIAERRDESFEVASRPAANGASHRAVAQLEQAWFSTEPANATAGGGRRASRGHRAGGSRTGGSVRCRRGTPDRRTSGDRRARRGTCARDRRSSPAPRRASDRGSLQEVRRCAATSPETPVPMIAIRFTDPPGASVTARQGRLCVYEESIIDLEIEPKLRRRSEPLEISSYFDEK